MTAPAGIPSPTEFFGHLKWLDGRPLLDVIEPYRARLFNDALYSFDDDGRPRHNLVLAGRAKKNWKSADLILAGLYRFLVWVTPLGNDVFLLATDEGQAGDDLLLAKRLVAANDILARELDVRAKELVRRDGRGSLAILPAKDIAGAHGKTYLFVGFDEIHTYRTWDLFEALAPDPTRADCLTWVTSYASLFNSPGAPLYDLVASGKRGDDPRMLFSWYAADYTTDPDLADADPEAKANPSAAGWADPDYLAQQRRRLPSHKYRRLHLNLPGSPTGAFFDAGAVVSSIVDGRRSLPPEADVHYTAFVDMSGGSSDDATLAIAHAVGERVVVDLAVTQAGEPPFNPRKAVEKFVAILERYGVKVVTGDKYAGETFASDFRERGIEYRACRTPKSDLYEELEPLFNAGEVELLDVPKLQEQLLTLVMRGAKVDHQSGDHDDLANSVAGVVWLVSQAWRRPAVVPRIRSLGDGPPAGRAFGGQSGTGIGNWIRTGE